MSGPGAGAAGGIPSTGCARGGAVQRHAGPGWVREGRNALPGVRSARGTPSAGAAERPGRPHANPQGLQMCAIRPLRGSGGTQGEVMAPGCRRARSGGRVPPVGVQGSTSGRGAGCNLGTPEGGSGVAGRVAVRGPSAMTETELERAEKRLAQAKARVQALRNREATKARKLDTRRKVILGGALIELAARDDGVRAMLDRLVRGLGRQQDRAAFEGWEPGDEPAAESRPGPRNCRLTTGAPEPTLPDPRSSSGGVDPAPDDRRRDPLRVLPCPVVSP